MGPPIDFVVYKKDFEYKILAQKCLNISDEEYSKVCNQWSDGIFKISRRNISFQKDLIGKNNLSIR